ncbi:MAG: GTP 3',8-cyclase MoaA, partial [Actinomycetota bacterium]
MAGRINAAQEARVPEQPVRDERIGGMTSTSTPPVLADAFGRPLRDLRISITDRCNFR